MGVVLDVAHVGNVARQLVKTDFVDEVAAHRVQEVGILIDDVLVVEKELVRLQQLLLLDHQLVRLLVVLHNLVILHVVVRDRLTPKHYQGVLVYHVQTH